MHKVIAMYNLKKDITVKKYKDWLVNVEMKVTPNLPDIYSFEVIEVKGSDGKGATYTIIEDFTVDNYDVWQKAMASDAMKEVASSWGEYADESTLKILYGELIE